MILSGCPTYVIVVGRRKRGAGIRFQRKEKEAWYYEGEITGYNATDKWYKVKYLDGGIEDLEEEEIRPLIKTIQQYEQQQRRRSNETNEKDVILVFLVQA